MFFVTDVWWWFKSNINYSYLKVIYLVNGSRMPTRQLEPSSFISENKKFPEYKRDLERWSRLTSIKLQAETVIYMLQDHPSRIKEKIDTKLGDELVNNKEGIKLLLEFLSTIYGDDDISDAYRK